ncbi:LPS export ABC transporter permease LptG [Pseudomonas asuensis]|jgi:lipopolysaccharide export system permease protein|uniref:LPS export ABC transporter permease LptG n=1 Tax=Pseudomonas asuensis TaxID=1825787 RepID=A0ABQ2GL90_9PSED|nr:LPS export ABC transporter permease LptG [Pseudomonas asuensis]GGM01511.1 LPS export ABC transporter permease LptG [Pseudomonas asuensis]
MKIIDKYLLQNLFIGFLAAAALLLPLFSTLDLVSELDDIGGDYRLIQAIEVVAMTLPRRMVELGPFIALLGGIAALGQLALTQELNTLRAAGISAARIGLSTVLAGALFAVALAAVDEFAASPLQQKAIQLRTHALASTEGNGKDGSIWGRKDQQFVRVGGLRLGRIPTHIEIFSFDGNQALKEYLFADYADIESEGLWQLHDVTVKRWVEGNETVEHLDQMTWQSVLPETRLQDVALPANSLSSRQLYHYIEFLKGTTQPAAQYEVALWEKLGTLLLTLAMILLAVPFSFSQVRSTGLGSKLALGAITGLLVYLANQIIVNLGILFGLVPMLVGTVPALVMLVFSISLILQLDRKR